MKRSLSILLTCLAVILLASPIAHAQKWKKKTAKKRQDYLVTISTSYGQMKLVLFDETPLHKENFLKLVREGFYDSTLFHRVIDEFMIQGGDPKSKGASPGISLGTGGPGYQVPAEFVSSLYHKKGALAAARQGDAVNPERKSSGSQFYIVQGKTFTEDELTQMLTRTLKQSCQRYLQSPGQQELRNEMITLARSEGQGAMLEAMLENHLSAINEELGLALVPELPAERIKAYTTIGGTPHLDFNYTVFGQVVEGIEVIDQVAQVSKDRRDRPTEDISITMWYEVLSKKEITKRYGITYPGKR